MQNKSLLSHKLSSLTEDNKKLKKLVQSTEIEIKSILKRNQEESNKVKKLLENVGPILEYKSSDKISQTKGSPTYLTNVYELENSFFQIKEMILEISVQNIAILKKIERRNKKNKLLEDANLDYKERINLLVIDKITYQEKILQQKHLNDSLLAFNLYHANDKEPHQNRILGI